VKLVVCSVVTSRSDQEAKGSRHALSQHQDGGDAGGGSIVVATCV